MSEANNTEPIGFHRVADKQSRAKPGEPGWDAAPNTDGTYFDNPYRTEPSRIKDPKWRDALGTWRDELGDSVVETNLELLQRQRGFEDVRGIAPLPSSTDMCTFQSGESAGAISAKVKAVRKNFVRAAACPEGIERLRMLTLAAMDAYQPAGNKFTPTTDLEKEMFSESKVAWEYLCTDSELSDLHYRRRATEHLVETYNETLKMGCRIDKAQRTQFFAHYEAIEVPTERRKCAPGLDGWFDVPRYPKGGKSKRGLGPDECWCYEERIGQDGVPEAHVVKRRTPTAGQYAMRAFDFAGEAQSGSEYVGALLGAAIGCALSRTFAPYSNAISEQQAERMVMLGRIKDFGIAQEQAEQRLQGALGALQNSPYYPKNAAAHRDFVTGLRARLDKDGRPVVDVDHRSVENGVTVSADGSGGIRVLPERSMPPRTPGSDHSQALG
jgi:hypothetical protein